MLTFTHMFVALALAYILKLPKLPAFLAALALDLDIVLNLTGLGFPFVHRGIIHTPLFLIALTAVWYHYGKRHAKNHERSQKNALSAGMGGLSHAMLDFVTNYGVPLLYPLSGFLAVPVVGYANIVANAGIILVSLVFIMLYIFRPGLFRETNKTKRTYRPKCSRMLVSFIIFVALILIVLWIGSFFEMYVWDPIAGYY